MGRFRNGLCFLTLVLDGLQPSKLNFEGSSPFARPGEFRSADDWLHAEACDRFQDNHPTAELLYLCDASQPPGGLVVRALEEESSSGGLIF